MGIKLSNGFTNIRPGDAQTVTISSVGWDNRTGKAVGRLRVTYKDERGGSGSDSFMLGSPEHPNEMGLNFFSTMARAALKVWGEYAEIEPEDLVGARLVVDVSEEPVTLGDGTERRYLRFRNYREAADEEDDGVFS